MEDRLSDLFRMQQLLNDKINLPKFLYRSRLQDNHPDKLTEAEKKEWLLHMIRAMHQELAELTDSVPWKWWAKYQKFNEQNARVEAVDLLHFLLSIFMILGMTPEDVFGMYYQKHLVNMKRQETGYAVKDEQDCAHIGAPKVETGDCT